MSEKYKIHAFYILLILIITIILLTTIQWTKIPNLSQYIIFALSITSLVLAVLTIIYTFYSNSTSTQNIYTLKETSQDISRTSKEITKTTNHLTQITENIPTRLETMQKTIEETRVMVASYHSSTFATSMFTTETRPKDKQQFLEELNTELIKYTSPMGLIILYTCLTSHRRNKPFNLNEICQSLTLMNETYAHGYLIALNSIGIINITININKITTVNKLPDKLADQITPELTTRFQEEKLKDLEDKLFDNLKIINQYFKTETTQE